MKLAAPPERFQRISINVDGSDPTFTQPAGQQVRAILNAIDLLSPDEKHSVIYGPDSSFHIASIDGSNDHLLASANVYYFAWNSDGSKLAFVEQALLPAVPGRSVTEPTPVPPPATLQIYDLKSGHPEEIPLGGTINEMVWSPDGQKLAVAQHWGAFVDNLLIVDVKSHKISETGVRFSTISPPKWTRDSQKLVLDAQDFINRPSRVAVYDVKSGRPASLTDGSFEDTAVAVSPDGKTVFFWRSAYLSTASMGLFAIPISGGTEKLLLPPDAIPDAAGGNVAWSPDGSRFALSSNNGGEQIIYIGDADASKLYKLITTEKQMDIEQLHWVESNRISFSLYKLMPAPRIDFR